MAGQTPWAGVRAVGAVAGLVAVTPAEFRHVTPAAALLIGVAGIGCYLGRPASQTDDRLGRRLDAFRHPRCGGIVGCCLPVYLPREVERRARRFSGPASPVLQR